MNIKQKRGFLILLSLAGALLGLVYLFTYVINPKLETALHAIENAGTPRYQWNAATTYAKRLDADQVDSLRQSTIDTEAEEYLCITLLYYGDDRFLDIVEAVARRYDSRTLSDLRNVEIMAANLINQRSRSSTE